MKVHRLPPIYSDTDEQLRAETLRLLAEIQKRYMKEIEPLHKILADIDTRSMPRVFLECEEGDPTPYEGFVNLEPAPSRQG